MASTEVMVKLTGIVVLTLLALLALFALLNWAQIAAPTAVSLGFATVDAPLGLILLAGSGLLTATFLVFLTYQQAAALMESRRFARDLHQHRQLADEAEASRFTELRAYLDGELRALSAHLGEIEDKLDRAISVGNVRP